LIKEKRTVLIASIKNLPAEHLQEIIKQLRGKAVVRVPKKNITFRAFDSAGIEQVKELKDKIQGDIAILFSDLDSFELAGELVKNKIPTKAKVGQEAIEDIEVHEGPTELMAGPAISELGAAGIPITIEGGKIHIKTNKVIVKKGAKISRAASDVMSKLDIKPFSVGFIPIAAFDKQDGKIYLNISIDKEKTILELKEAFGRALPFAVEVGYICEDTIKFMIRKAAVQEKALVKLENTQQNSKEENQ
jgi:large subunit ribosomal protein L10